MSILIKDMEMPTSCEKCIFRSFSGVDLWKCILNEETFNSWEVGWGDETLYVRHKSCPLIPIPPHGDLIESKAFLKVAHETDDFSLDELAHLAVLVAATPTIIPADESDMDSFIHIFEEDDENDEMDSFIHIFEEDDEEDEMDSFIQIFKD